MTQEQIRYAKETGNLHLSFWDKFTHYGIVLGIGAIPLVVVGAILINNTKHSKPVGSFLVLFAIVPSIVAVIAFILQKNRLKFEVVVTSLEQEKIEAIIEDVAKKLNWEFYKKNKEIIVAKTHPSFFSGSWGEQITILLDKNKVFVNSICDPDKRSSVTSMGRNKKNEKTLIKALKKASS